MATLVNTSSTVQTVYLHGKVSDGGKIRVFTDPKFIMPQPVVLQPKIPFRLNIDNIGQVFSPDHLVFQGITKDEILFGPGLPEGDWTICIQAFDYMTKEPLSDEDPQGCSNAFTISDIEPAIIVQPECGEKIPATTPQMLNVVWIRPVGAPRDTKYNLKIFVVPTGTQNINEAVKSGTL
ncbi:MAG: hypothetical protein ISS19_16415, partial [Bacteroidales bacterium]|nr:hypothetical protein [Bacteroidales bacterium]